MGKIIDYKNLDPLLQEIKSTKKLVVAGGVFDVIHPGHIKFLEESKKLGNALLIILESDQSVRRKKGIGRPVNNAKRRAQTLLNIKAVDFVLTIPDFKEDNDYYKLTKKLEPAIIAVTKNDPYFTQKKDQAKLVGGKVVEVIKRLPNFSTTRILNKQ